MAKKHKISVEKKIAHERKGSSVSETLYQVYITLHFILRLVFPAASGVCSCFLHLCCKRFDHIRNWKRHIRNQRGEEEEAKEKKNGDCCVEGYIGM